MKVGCGGEFSIILDCKGAMHSFGLPEYGQLGECDSSVLLSCFSRNFKD